MAIREGNTRKSVANPDRKPRQGSWEPVPQGGYPGAYAWGLYPVSHSYQKKARHNRAMLASESDKSMQNNALTYQLFCS